VNVKDLPVVSGDPYLNELLIKYCEDALSYRQGSRSALRFDLETEIVQLLAHGKTQMSEIARRLGMSQRTLARRLSSEGLTFAGILADLRVDLAKRHLTDEDLAISQIAWPVSRSQRIHARIQTENRQDAKRGPPENSDSLKQQTRREKRASFSRRGLIAHHTGRPQTRCSFDGSASTSHSCGGRRNPAPICVSGANGNAAD
jgi:AraC-like DNA-binding protein